MSDKPGDDSKTGYGKPPVHSQFKKGQSGNPKGRPRNPMTSAFERVLAQPAELRDGSTATRLDRIAERLVRWAEDDTKCMQILFKELRHGENSVVATASGELPADDALSVVDGEADVSNGDQTGSGNIEISENQSDAAEETS